MSQALLFPKRKTYFQKVMRLDRSGLIALWPQSEPTGASAALCYSGAAPAGDTAKNGSYNNVTLGVTGIGDGRTAARYASSYTNIYSAALAAAFSPSAGTLAGWSKVDAAAWTDAAIRMLVQLRTNASNRVRLLKNSSNNNFVCEYTAGGVTDQVLVTVSSTGWLHWAITWDVAADQVIAYLNGAQSGATQTTLGTWVGALSSTACFIGAVDTTPNNPWAGDLAYVGLWNVALAPHLIAALAQVGPPRPF